ncbi:uncharacterized protein LOC115215290 [Argonauta hians]
MNKYMNRPQNQFGRKYRGFMEPMNMMSMDFQGRYMDSYGRMVDPRNYGYYGRYSDQDRYYGRSMYNYYGFYDNDRYNRQGYFMDFPERFMDMSGYQMDMYGRWMDMQGQHSSPYWHMFNSSRHGYYPGYQYGRNYFYPERFIDMSYYQMDMYGRYMDRFGRFCNPYYNYYRSYMYYTFMNFYYSYYPERFMDMSNYQMDMYGRWMDMYGRYSSPYYNYFGRYYHNYPYYSYSWGNRHYSYPERYFDMANYQMDFEGRWMDMYSRHCTPFYNYYGRYHHNYPYFNYMWGQRSFNNPDSHFEMDYEPFNQMYSYGNHIDNYRYKGNNSGPYYFGYYSYYPYPSQRNNPDMNVNQLEIQYNSMDLNNRNRDQINVLKNSDYHPDFENQWMNANNYRYVFSKNQQQYSPYNIYFGNCRYGNQPERFFDAPNYQVEFGGKWPSQEYEYASLE